MKWASTELQNDPDLLKLAWQGAVKQTPDRYYVLDGTDALQDSAQGGAGGRAGEDLHQAHLRNKLKFVVESGGPIGAAGDRSGLLSQVVGKAMTIAAEGMGGGGGKLRRAATKSGGEAFSMSSRPTMLSSSSSSSSSSSVSPGEEDWPISPEWKWGARVSARRKSIKKLAFTYCPVLGREVKEPTCESRVLVSSHSSLIIFLSS